ncbi:OmpA family protein [uncultured Chitinophaga sp.]|uniref:OmpA family protein n=1 Tax=uncultured Chitinophaga sp. TaxID=339340 RepID=UPI0025D18A63|nr:OmpA family protein [uncultured Chitinophaga sp.]
MSFDLLNTVRAVFSGDYISKVAGQLAEPEGGIQKALAAVVPTILTGLLAKVTAPGDAGSVFGLVKDAATHPPGPVSQGISGAFIQKGTQQLSALFGNKTENISNALAEYAGIKSSSAHALLQSTTPATLGEVGKYAIDHRMSPLGFMAFLNNHKDDVLKAVPSGLGLASLLGLGSLDDIGRRLSGIIASIGGGEHTSSTVDETAATSGGRKWTIPLLVILVIVLLLWWLLRGCGNKTNVQVPPRDTVITSQMENDAVNSVSGPEIPRESIKVILPNGKELDAYKGGIEDQLVNFLKDPAAKPGKDVWFDFDNLNFETGSAQITPESRQQVNNLAAILDAFPATKIKIGGYTDKQGDEAVNLKLSKERAEAVIAALQGANAKPAQLQGAEGYGSQYAKAAANAPDEDRKTDRRISVSVREK